MGETVVVETINFVTPIIGTAADANPKLYREREETGPIFVKDIHPGDVLAIHILDISPEGHASGGWYNDPSENSFLEIAGGKVHFPGGLWTPLRMMIGDIYVTPTEPVPNPGDNGGNMDFRDIAAGNALCLRAELPGGLLVLGDVHAYQGDGEILGLAAECAAEVTIRVTKEETFLSDRPLIKKSESFVAIACRPDYAEARALAVEDATKILSRVAGCTENEAYLYVATAGELRNGAVWQMGKTEPEWVKTANLTVAVEVPLYGIRI